MGMEAGRGGRSLRDGRLRSARVEGGRRRARSRKETERSLFAGASSPSCFAATIKEQRSPHRFVASPLGIKSWVLAMPSCAQARPGACPCCGAAAQPPGRRVVLVGHGVVDRQLRGPATAYGPPEQTLVTLRRYRCRACSAVVVVGPRGLVVRRWYSAAAISVALRIFADGGTSAEARARTCPAGSVGGSAVDRWMTLARWVDAARQGQLFAVGGLAKLRPREVAHHVTLALAARGGHIPGVDLAESAFAGAAVAA